MSAAEKWLAVSVDDYLAGELQSDVKHEYLGGVLHAMAGARNRHNRIEKNTLVALSNQLSGKPCDTWNSNTKVRITLPTQTRFYYPDVTVACQPNSEEETYQDQPVVLVEILSRSTRRTDLGEKRDAYQSIPSLKVYVLLEQERCEAIVYRRGDQGFEVEFYDKLTDLIPLPEIDAELLLEEVCESVEFGPEPEDSLR